MPKYQDEKMKNDPEYDLSNPADLEVVKAFEQELAGRSFDQYCLDVGYKIAPDKKYPTGAVDYSMLPLYEEARRKMKGLEKLRAKRTYAKKMDHLGKLWALGFRGCPDSPGRVEEEKVCRICYPELNGKDFRTEQNQA